MSDITENELSARIAEISVSSRLGMKYTLGPITDLMEHLGHPEQKFPSVHVGGTSGKGSTATYIANILAEAGYRVGLFTKPHLSSVRERLVINGCPISANEMMELLERVSRYESEKPTWFELTTALAFQFFHERQVDVGVIEVGLGGTYDATNVLLPELSVLTNVGLDHTEILGDTVEKIAADKVGIIKPGKRVVSGVTQPSVIEIVEDQCWRSRAQLKLLGRDFECSNVVLSTSGGGFDFILADDHYEKLTMPVLGRHQVVNATVAAAAAITMGEAGFQVTETAIRNGLSKTAMPGRMEIVNSSPTILLDGAHSPPKMASLAEAIRNLFSDRRIIGVLAFSEGHDATATLSELAPLLDSVILTNFNAFSDYGSRRAQPPEVMAALLAEKFPQVECCVEPDPFRAVKVAKKMANPEDLVCVSGSIFLVGQVRPVLLGE
jgi:dihydrofolate synthase / folylpolyglutamate synthase